MAITGDIPTIPEKFTEGDLENLITVRWNVVVTTETSELAIDRPEPAASIIVAGVLLDAATGTFEHPWSAGDLIAGEKQLVKARLSTAPPVRRKSTAHFRIDVDEDIS